MAGVALRVTNSSIATSLLLASLAPPCCADPAPVVHYAPGENLEHVDVPLIDRAERETDMAAYVLTDWAIMQALTRGQPYQAKSTGPATEPVDDPDRKRRGCGGIQANF